MSRLLTLASCALLGPLMACAAVSGDREASLRTSWGNCVSSAVARLDNGRDDPASVAFGVVPQCHSIYNELTEVMMSGYFTDAGRANMRAEMRSGETQLVTAAVLTHRKSTR